MIVVDASVLVGFVLPPDAYHEDAIACRDRDADWHVPFLARTEFRSVAVGYLRRGEALDTLVEAGALAVLSARVHHLTDAEVFAVLQSAPLSAYDAEYVALARRLGCKLVTTDREVLKAFPRLAARLSEYAAGR
ncbi:MAG: type II toxin-antitoxin system VapC family toxin [Planctomycetota bacterium]|nr:type II toxin-antitoxin system VapC family toxin [Planctomycetota bacterium]